MVRITEDLIRKRAEHNDCEITTLEEISLHQQDIERIEHIDRWCKDLKILYLQSNLIPKIENVGRLKKLEYLNLALNNVERIENLEGCESLVKLDLTVNFVGELTSIDCLQTLQHFRELYLTGNPCTDYTCYRQYVIATLPLLSHLDGTKVEKSERIQAIQDYPELKENILCQQNDYRKKRKEQIANDKIRKEQKANRKDKGPGFDGRWYTDINTESVDNKDEKANERELEGDDKSFWEEKVPYTPESRIDIHEHIQEQKRRQEPKDEREPKPPRRLMDDNGRPLNINEAKMEFSFEDIEETNCYILDLAYYRYMDTSLMDIDVQPDYIRVTAKGKVFQLRLEEEVNADAATAQRSQVTGHLLVTVPKAKAVLKAQKKSPRPVKERQKDTKIIEDQGWQKLEVDPLAKRVVDYRNIAVENKDKSVQCCPRPTSRTIEKPSDPDFIDDPNVPPLI